MPQDKEPYSFYKFCCPIVKKFFNTFYRSRVFGRENLPEVGCLIASNHASYYDPPFIGGCAWPVEIHFLAEQDLFNNFFLGSLIKNLHAHPLHGSVKDFSTFKNISYFIEQRHKILIFPEGMRATVDKLHPFKRGVARMALRTNAPIIPTYIRGTMEAWPVGKLWPTFGQTLTCVFGKPIQMAPYLQMEKKEAIEALTNDVYTAMDNLRLWLNEHDR